MHPGGGPLRSDPSTDGVRPQAYAPWQQAWAEALYGPAGFYRRPEGPAGHFRTAAHAAADDLARALARLARTSGCTAVVDVGAGRGELLTALAAADPGLRLHGADVVGRPSGLPPGIGWTAGLDGPPATALTGALLVGWELLDAVPCPVLELDEHDEPRLVLVEPATGRERLGGPPDPADLAWCEHWWPLGGLTEGDRVEVGRPRDELWARLAGRLAAAGGGVLLAVDYDHDAAARPPEGSLTGFARGRAVPPRPDGSADVTAHVALDAVAAAAETAATAAGCTVRTRLTRQDVALRELGATTAELLDPGGLGGFGWLLQSVDPPR